MKNFLEDSRMQFIITCKDAYQCQRLVGKCIFVLVIALLTGCILMSKSALLSTLAISIAVFADLIIKTANIIAYAESAFLRRNKLRNVILSDRDIWFYPYFVISIQPAKKFVQMLTFEKAFLNEFIVLIITAILIAILSSLSSFYFRSKLR